MKLNSVTVLLAIYNGEAYLKAQLDSFVAQQDVRWTLLASDDQSTDASLSIVQAFAAARPSGQVQVLSGPQAGGAANFLSLLARAPKDAACCAFSDQDDVWLPHKLARATAALAGHKAGPAAYFSRTLVCRADLSGPHPSRMYDRPFGFRNALVQNVMSGNTIVLNAAARDLLQEVLARMEPSDVAEVLLHDWWVYQILSGCGAHLIFDAEPGLLYRQHGGNQVGANDGLAARIYRIGFLLRGGYAAWNRRNREVLQLAAPWLTPENRTRLDAFSLACTAPRFQTRIKALRRAGVYRQGKVGAMLPYVLALLRLL